MNSSPVPPVDCEPRNLWVVDLAPRTESILQEVVRGLEPAAASNLPPKLFYDRRGAELFTAICSTRAYYPTRTENAILERRAVEIARQIGSGSVLIEFGAGRDREGAAVAAERCGPTIYAALDISRDQLVRASTAWRWTIRGCR